MVMRDRFDQLLADRAVEAGVELVDGTPVRSIEQGATGFRLQTVSGSVSARLLVGADGANSIVARETGLGAGLTESCALEAELSAPTAALARWRASVNVDFGYRPSGYGWVFPKHRLLSVGLVRQQAFADLLRTDLGAYLARLGLAGATIERLVGHKVLFRRAHERIAGSGVVLVGDAAGLVDEFTEEGIFYAIRSGVIAARIVQRALEGGHRWLGAYERAIDRELMPELRAARTIARLFYGSLSRAPAGMLQVSRRVDYLWRAFFRVQRGESTYDAEIRRALVIEPFARVLLR
jgi:flavin-dependent dehydrogenase